MREIAGTDPDAKDATVSTDAAGGGALALAAVLRRAGRLDEAIDVLESAIGAVRLEGEGDHVEQTLRSLDDWASQLRAQARR